MWSKSKSAFVIVLVTVIVLGGVGGFYVYNTLRSSNVVACQDPDSISAHVYNPSRLQLVKQCVTASGIVEDVRSEDDGDYHVLLQLDAAYSNMTNDANKRYQHGWLVVEIICAKTPTQADAIDPCKNYQNKIPIPNTGQRITVSGPYVLDTEHFNWAEIHPVYSLTVS